MSDDPLTQPVSLRHLKRLTDCFGLIQHANYGLPIFRTGYTTDDNARALVVALKHYHLYQDPSSLELVERYLAFLMYAQLPDGRFHNFIGYDRRPLDEVGSEDAFGRALWSLAHVLAAPPTPHLIMPAERLLHEALGWVESLHHPRARAYALLAMYHWSRSERCDLPRARRLARLQADALVAEYQEHCRPGWEWFRPDLTYANALLPKALFRAHQLLGEAHYLAVAQSSMEFLLRVTCVDEALRAVGNKEWISPDDSPELALYDQQPIEAGLMVEAALTAYEVTGEPRYLRVARHSLEWFFGRNIKGAWLYDPETGGCFDALMEGGVNQNRGAESTVAMLLSQLLMLETKSRSPEATLDSLTSSV